jgi:hypothetical protein
VCKKLDILRFLVLALYLVRPYVQIAFLSDVPMPWWFSGWQLQGSLSDMYMQYTFKDIRSFAGLVCSIPD